MFTNHKVIMYFSANACSNEQVVRFIISGNRGTWAVNQTEYQVTNGAISQRRVQKIHNDTGA